MSGLEVIGGISAVTGIIEACANIYGSVQKDLKLPETFHAVARQLPILTDTLATCKNHLELRKTSIASDVCTALENTLENCEEKARNLRTIFEKVISIEADGWEKRYVKVLRRLGKGNKVEELMKSITEDVQHVVNNDAVRSAKPEQQEQLNKIIRDLQSLESSITEEFVSSMTFNNTRGTQNNNTGDGQQFNYESMSGKQDFHFVTRLKENFSFVQPFGLHLGQAPYVDPKLFIGRGSEIQGMTAILEPSDDSDEQRRLVLGGMGGIGKTQLAIAYAKGARDRYASVFWLNATSEGTLKASLQSMGERIFELQDPKSINYEQMVVHVKRWLCDSQNKRWLLIFDNYDDPKSYDLEEYYPSASHGNIIITTRLPGRVSGAQVLVHPLGNIDDSLQILESRSQRKDLTNDSHARRLAERLQGLPLALATAGAYLRRSRWSFKKYLHEYNKRWNIDPRHSSQLTEYRNRTLYTTWDLSYERLEEECLEAAKLLTILPYFDNQAIWYELFRAGAQSDLPKWLLTIAGDAVEFDNMMGILIEYCFIELQLHEIYEAHEAYGIHICIHDWASASLKDVINPRSYWYAFDCVAESVKAEEWDLLGHPQYAPLVPHAARLTHEKFYYIANNISSDYVDKAEDIAQLLQMQIRLGPAAIMQQIVLCANEKVLGSDHTSTLNTVNNLAILYKDQDKLAEAEQMYLRALAGRETVLGPDHNLTLDTVHNLGGLYYTQGKSADAEHMYLRALAGRETALGPNHTSTLDTVHNLGLLYANQGKLAEAEQMYQRVLAGRDIALGPDRTSTFGVVNSLGNLYLGQGRLVEAEQMFLQALAGYNRSLGPDHTSTLGVVNNLGNLYRDQGKLAKAEQMYLRALAGREKALGLDHTSTLATVNNLGLLYQDQGRFVEAEQMYQRALAGGAKALGPDHTSTLVTVHNLGHLYANQGKLEEAEQMYQRALAGEEEALGPDHTSTLDTVHNLGLLYANQGKLAEAEQMYQRVLAGRDIAFGPDHTSTFGVVNSLGNLYLDQGRLAEAERMFLQALAGYKRLLGPDHTSTLSAINSLGNLYLDQGKLAEAEQMYQRALAGRETVLGPDHTSTLATINSLGNLYLDQGKLAEAEQISAGMNLNQLNGLRELELER